MKIIGSDNVTSNGLRLTRSYSTNIGNGVNTTYIVTHGLETQDIVISLRETVSPYNAVIPSNLINSPMIQITSANTITIKFAKAPTLNKYRITVIG